MAFYIVEGGAKLNGEVLISGAKNSALPILASTILNDGISILKNVPIIDDTLVAIEILRDLGCEVLVYENTVIVDAKNINNIEINENLVKKMRCSIIFLGAILSRCKKAIVSYPGGCNLGKRPIDYHINAFKQMGIKISDDKTKIKASVKNIKDSFIELPFASVGATQNVMLASIFCRDKIIIKNAAREPEIIDMANFLRSMGADIYGDGKDTIIIKGVKKISKVVEHTIMSDRIEAGTFLCMTAITNGKVKLKNIDVKYLKRFINEMSKIGIYIEKEKNDLIVIGSNKLKAINYLETKPYPYFPTDLQPQMMAVLSMAKGDSIIKETIFEARNKHIKYYNKLGAKIKCKDNLFIITGTDEMTGCDVLAEDLRGGAGLITLALASKGKTKIDGAYHINRGYENINKKLNLLGANIKYIEN